MSEFSLRMAEKALAMITKRGVGMTLERAVRGALDAAGDRTSAPNDSPTVGLYVPTGGTAIVDGREVKVDKVLLAAVAPPPEPGNHVIIPAGIHEGHYLVNRALNQAPEGELIYSELEVVV